MQGGVPNMQYRTNGDKLHRTDKSKTDTYNSKANTSAPHKEVIKAKERTNNKTVKTTTLYSETGKIKQQKAGADLQ